MKINQKSMLYGTLVLTGANLIVRILGFAYRVILSRLIGPQGMGLVQLVMPVFLISITFTTAGLPVAVSRLVSERKAKGDIQGIRKIVRTALMLSAGISLVITILTLTNINLISDTIIKDHRTRAAMFILFPNVIIIGLGVVLKGYFYGIKDIHPPALAEIIEQLVRMTATLFILYRFAPLNNYATAAALVMLGTVLGELSSLLFLHYSYFKAVRKEPTSRFTISNEYLRVIGAIAVPITATRLINSFMSATNSVLVPRRLVASGMVQDAAVGLFGIMTGMTMPLIFLPFTITNALSVVIIPNLSENKALNNWNEIHDKVSKAISITCITAFAAMALFISIGKPVGDALYKQPLVGELLIPLSFSLLFYSLQHTSGSILNGLGKQTQSSIHFILGSMVQLLCTYYLVANPRLRLYGMIIGIVASSILVSLLNLYTVLSHIKMSFKWKEWLLKPGFAGLAMTSIASALYQIMDAIKLNAIFSLVTSALIGLMIYIISLWAMGSLAGVISNNNSISYKNKRFVRP